MSTRAAKGTHVRGYRRRKAVLDLDLNNAPPIENRDQEGTSTQVGRNEVQAGQVGQSVPPATIDVEAIDDDVIESSPTAFAQAKNNSRRNQGRTVVDVDLEERTRATQNNRNKRRRVPPSPPIINCDLYINLESSSNSTRESVIMQPPPPPPPPKEPTFSCPICMGPLVEEMSTRCGHIFCKACIKTAISTQAKCPTCRKHVTVKELIRVFLPSTS
uniref:RING-type domain-containing protein n=1 Tax=Fagus sylvatica TaxID=28930 RepID=A0A2N9J3D1_FAGSY